MAGRQVARGDHGGGKAGRRAPSDQASRAHAKKGRSARSRDAWSVLSEGSTCKRAGLRTGAGRRDLHMPVARRPRRREAQARSSPGPPRQAPPRAEWATRGSNLAIRSDFCGRLTRRPGRDGSAIRSGRRTARLGSGHGRGVRFHQNAWRPEERWFSSRSSGTFICALGPVDASLKFPEESRRWLRSSP